MNINQQTLEQINRQLKDTQKVLIESNTELFNRTNYLDGEVAFLNTMYIKERDNSKRLANEVGWLKAELALTNARLATLESRVKVLEEENKTLRNRLKPSLAKRFFLWIAEKC